mmetsp:Transcript_10951/g.18152  ORF Transcript_10951/g.18152 Transcript_10951/m.18152 type:complete len:732 (-) Transcript_10951:95-2290(-)|eukprot:CAMPEP_0119008110 /NCGR_PEP_ID=MMETSP1176-20130426/3467_1 /TAXON_ID=265551 /ORGANISM="Synedropsis recta cf, Strain CCMP1620" /LENGTH=731 /DNA_ID=CAMNT_0006960381 /DNA_START=290 /DNA_END=2485 /DNA_ORIENTATION=+
MNQIASLFTAILLLCTLSSVWSSSSSHNNKNSKKGLRGIEDTVLEDTVLKCRVLYVGTEMLNSAENDEEYMCMPIVDDVVSEFAYPLTLPPSFLDEYADKLYASDRDILIERGQLIDEDHVRIPDDALIQLVRASRVVTVADEYVTRKMLIVRVSTEDREPSLNATQLSEKTFALRDYTMRSQYLACSHGKLAFNPYVPPANTLTTISGGVLDVKLNMKADGTSRIALTNAAIAATQNALGTKLADVVDNVIICHPPGSLGGWVAYAFPNNVVSVYNDKWCGYVSSTMHEVGHNLGFLHSNQRGEYNDKTGYMGFSYGIANWPAVCFNGHKNWLSGWFSDRVLEVDPAIGVFRGKLATSVDYQLTHVDEYVVIKVGDLYIQYNRAKGMNFQTLEMQNQVTIVEDRPKSSELLAGIDGRFVDSKFYSQENYGENGETLYIAVCGEHLGNNVTTPDMMYISIGLDAIECYNPVMSTPIKLPVPSLPKAPSSAPSTSTSPTETPSPSWIKPDRGEACDDNMFESFYVGETLGEQNCQWLQESRWYQTLLCVPGLPAHNVCAETCGKCSDDCEDDDRAIFSYNQTFTTCSLLRQADPSTWETICNEEEGAVDHCLETCNSCPSAIDNPESCDDSQDQIYRVEGVGNRRCAWLAQPPQSRAREKFCKPDNPVFHICAETCGKCFDNCHDDATARFLYNAKPRTCQWLSSKPLQWKAACGNREDIRTACKDTCENCD